MISARYITDDGLLEVEFDAEAYFEQATDEQLRDLADCGWGGDYPADWVAEYIADLAKPYGRRDAAELKGCMEYLDLKNQMRNRYLEDPTGFEVYVDEESAEAWIATNRPHLIADRKEEAA